MDLAPWVSDLTPSGLLGVGVVLLMTGYLIPARVVRGRIEDKNAIITELRSTVAILQRNNAQLLKGNTATVQVLDALPEVVGGEVDAENH